MFFSETSAAAALLVIAAYACVAVRVLCFSACTLQDYRGITLVLQQLRTEQQEEAFRKQQQQMQRSLLGGLLSHSSNRSSGSGSRSTPHNVPKSSNRGSSNSGIASSAMERCVIIVDPTQLDELDPQHQNQQQEQHHKKELSLQQFEQVQQQPLEPQTDGEEQNEVKYSPDVECCFISGNSSSSCSRRSSGSSSGSDSSGSGVEVQKILWDNSPLCTSRSNRAQEKQQEPLGNNSLSATPAAGAADDVHAAVTPQTSRRPLQAADHRLQTPQRSAPLQQQQQQQWGVRTPESLTTTPSLKTLKINVSSQSRSLAKARTPLSGSSSSSRGRGLTGIRGRQQRAAAAAAATVSRPGVAAASSSPFAPAAMGVSPIPTQRSLEYFLPHSSTKDSPYPIQKTPKQQQLLQLRRKHSSHKMKDPALAAGAPPNVVSLLTQNTGRKSTTAALRSCSKNRISNSALELSSQDEEHQQQQQEDSCCNAADRCSCLKSCVAQCMSLLCPVSAPSPRPPLMMRIVTISWHVLLLLLQHAAAAGAEAAKNAGIAALVAAAVAGRIAAADGILAVTSSSPKQSLHEIVAAAAPQMCPGEDSMFENVLHDLSAPAVKPEVLPTRDVPFAVSNAGSSVTANNVCKPALTLDGTCTGDDAVSSLGPYHEGAHGERKDAAAAAGAAEGAAAEGAYWECMVETLDAFEAALRGVACSLAALGAFEERQLLLRAVLRTIQSAESSIAAASAAAAAAAAYLAAVVAPISAGVSEKDTSCTLSLLLLRLLASPAGRLVWPLMLHRAQDVAGIV